ncbi:hypothetical protein BDN70DRAFT_342970 [Pholiota conissans]|uniref:Secreted protein n=1 Tax=Pholiota conissans TaxID=109636 RepID=A0A9P5Z8X0_9AGAR|nr:hypothetical protein BDN70DRAFT_342970 [Pholiota conissans]
MRCCLFTLSIGLCSGCSFRRLHIPIPVTTLARIIHSSAIPEPQGLKSAWPIYTQLCKPMLNLDLVVEGDKHDGRLDDDGFHESLPSEAAHHSAHHHLGSRRRFSQVCFLHSMSQTSNEIIALHLVDGLFLDAFTACLLTPPFTEVGKDIARKHPFMLFLRADFPCSCVFLSLGGFLSCRLFLSSPSLSLRQYINTQCNEQ